MLNWLKRLRSPKPQMEDSPPLEKYISTCIHEALKRKADKIFFGEPDDTLPRVPRLDDPTPPDELGALLERFRREQEADDERR